MAKISKDMLINDILAVDAGNAAILMAQVCIVSDALQQPERH